MKKLRLGIALALAIAIASLFGPGAAIADDMAVVERASDIDEQVIAKGRAAGLERVSVTVPIADLNLNNEQGAMTLYRRLQQASETVCGVRIARDMKCLRSQQLSNDCFEQTLSNAVKTVDSDTLTQLHKG
jgi:UrcA family protein